MESVWKNVPVYLGKSIFHADSCVQPNENMYFFHELDAKFTTYTDHISEL